MNSSTLTVACPDCGASMRIDAATGEVLSHQPARKTAPAKDFDALLAAAETSSARAEETFQRGLRKLEDHSRRMDETFRQELRRAREEDDGEPPERPWDLD